MKIKTLVLVAAAAFGLAGTNAVFACSTAAWNGNETGNPQEGRPADGVARYSGQCGLKATALNNFVTDTTPLAEQTFRARFYVYTGLTAGTAQVFRARNAGAAQQIGVTYTHPGTLTFNTSSGSNTVTVTPSRWYSVELDWSATRGNMLVTVRGAAATANSLATVTGVNSADRIDDVQLGWVTGTGTASTAGIVTDAYESRRSTAIGQLCVANANASDNTRNVLDLVAMINEINNVSLASGQPDGNEDGAVNVLDMIAALSFINSANPACP